MKWDTIQLGDVLDVKHGYAFKSEFFADSGEYILLSPGNCHESGGLKLKGDKEKHYVGEFPPEYLLNEGDMLVVMTDLVNRAPILGGSLMIPENNRFLHNQRLGLVQITDDRRVEKRFLYYLLNTHDYRAQVRGSASGATVRHTAPGRIKECTVRVPRDVAYQHEIGSILSAYDNLIENNMRRIELLEQAARLLYEEWFVHLRFPGREQTRITEGVPGRWTRMGLASACVDDVGIQTGPFGSQLHQSDYSEDGIPVVMPKDMIGERVSTNSIARVPEAIRDRLTRHILEEGDTVLARRGDIGRKAFVSKREAGWMCGTGCMRLRPNPTVVLPRFFFVTVGRADVMGIIASRAQGAIMPNLNLTLMSDVPVVIPPLHLQREYVDYATPMHTMAEVLSQQNQRLHEARDLLLPRLMSGEVIV